jgi:hypothetical protein
LNRKRSHDETLVQVADFFAGLASWASANYDLYQRSATHRDGQGTLFGDEPPKMTNSEACRCEVLRHLLMRCSQHRFTVSLKNRQLKTMMGGACGMNFWPWLPQGEYDKAPTRDAG